MCRLNVLYSYFIFWEHALQNEVPSGSLSCVIYLVHPVYVNRFVRLFPIIYNCSLPEFFDRQGSNPVDF